MNDKVFDRRVILSGAMSGLFFALPAAILQRTVFSESAMAGVMVGIVFFSGALAGYAAARPMPSRALMHGAAAGLITFIGAQLVFLISTLKVPSATDIVGIVLFGLLFSSLGTIGAYVALWRAANDAAKTS
jgi:putative membrane protein (TIGR04086 family)